VLPRLDTFLGRAFEKLLALAYARILRSRGLPLVQLWAGGRVGTAVAAR
jgi:hypothetical protein